MAMQVKWNSGEPVLWNSGEPMLWNAANPIAVNITTKMDPADITETISSNKIETLAVANNRQ